MQSADLAAQLTKPTRSYKNSARLAVAGLLAFITLYFALAGWFLYTAYRVFFKGQVGAMGGLAYLVAIVAAFLGIFMLKALFSVRSVKPEGLHELSPQEQPKLFAFLNELADAAGAPRPHKVFVSARVNAAVFYDLSLFNLIFPSKKNLEIGLGLVNALSLGEFRAVLAHEFGHFAQRSMAVGRWVYVAQQIASHLVTRRDALDGFLVGLGNIDLRLRAGVAVVQLIVWSIRSLVEQAFQVVVLMQRALSREMEMQADLVAVSLTGSDALIHALHRMHGADDAWDRALSFIYGQRASGRATRDVFAVQSHMVQRMSAILDDEGYAKVPPLPEQGRSKHRVFKAEMAQPPRMWLTHPLNHEREANAKRLYVPAEIDPASAWSVFNHPLQVREQMTARLLGETDAAPTDLEESLKALARQFKREQYNRRYGGAFFGRSLARHAGKVQELRNPARLSTLEELASLYPESLKHDVQQLRALENEKGQLGALISGALTAPGGVVRLRGSDYRRKQLPAALRKVEAEIEELQGRLRAHDYLCRSWHQGTAAGLDGKWQPYLDGLLALVHYTEHTSANLQDLNGMLQNVTAVITAVRRVTADGVRRIVLQANELHHAMDQVYRQAGQLELDKIMCQRLELNGNWGDMLGEFTFSLAQADNINEWLNNCPSWLSHIDNCLTAVRSAALEQLLVSETMIVRVARQGGVVVPAPAPSTVPASYALLLPGAERKRQTQLSLWARFQRADGWLPGGARLLVAGTIVAIVLGASTVGDNKLPGFAGSIGSFVAGKPTLMVHNGLALPVTVKVDAASVTVPAYETRALEMAASGAHHVEARSKDGRLIEQFNADDNVGAHTVYNVAGADLLVEWTASYGKVEDIADRRLGTPRWLDSKADFLFTKPPEKISGKGQGGHRSVLDGASRLPPEQQLAMLPDDDARKRVAALHAKWDLSSEPGTIRWIAYAAQQEGSQDVLAERIAAAPGDVMLRRLEYDVAAPGAKAALCRQATERAAAAPDDGDLAYLSIRCRRAPDTDAQFRAARQRWPDNPWIVNAVTFAGLHSKNWPAMVPDLELVRRLMPMTADASAVTIARIKRFEGSGDLAALAAASASLRSLIELEQGTGPADGPARAYAQLAAGSLGAALAMSGSDAWKGPHVLRLAAASDGAGEETVRRALALPIDKGLDAASAWSTLALAMRAGIDTKPLLAATREQGDQDQPAVAAFLADLQAGKGPALAERRLETVAPEARGHAYSAALVLIGPRAPQAWREQVKRLLFASERPYFR